MGISRNPIIERALAKGFKSGGIIGDIGGGTGAVVTATGGGRGGFGSGTRSEARRLGGGGAIQTQTQIESNLRRQEELRRITIKEMQRRSAQQKIGVVTRRDVDPLSGEVTYIGIRGQKVTFPKGALTFTGREKFGGTPSLEQPTIIPRRGEPIRQRITEESPGIQAARLKLLIESRGISEGARALVERRLLDIPFYIRGRIPERTAERVSYAQLTAEERRSFLPSFDYAAFGIGRGRPEEYLKFTKPPKKEKPKGPRTMAIIQGAKLLTLPVTYSSKLFQSLYKKAEEIPQGRAAIQGAMAFTLPFRYGGKLIYKVGLRELPEKLGEGIGFGVESFRALSKPLITAGEFALTPESVARKYTSKDIEKIFQSPIKSIRGVAGKDYKQTYGLATIATVDLATWFLPQTAAYRAYLEVAKRDPKEWFQKPLETGLYLSAGFAFGFGPKAVSSIAKRTTQTKAYLTAAKIWPKGIKAGEFLFKGGAAAIDIGLPVAFVGSQYVSIFTQPTYKSKLARLSQIDKELLLLSAGARLGTYLYPRAEGFITTVGRKELPLETVAAAEVIETGRLQRVSPKKHLKLFREATSPFQETRIESFYYRGEKKIPLKQDLVVFHAATTGKPTAFSEAIWGGGGKLIPGKDYLPGGFVAPGDQAALFFLKLGGAGLYYTKIGSIFKGVSPKLAAIYPKGIRLRKSVPLKIGKGKIRIGGTDPRKFVGKDILGVVDVPGIKIEPEGILPPGTKLKLLRKGSFIKYKGVRVPIDEFKIADVSKISKVISKVTVKTFAKISTFYSIGESFYSTTSPFFGLGLYRSERDISYPEISKSFVSSRISFTPSKSSLVKYYSSIVSPISKTIPKISKSYISSKTYPYSSLISITSKESYLELLSYPLSSITLRSYSSVDRYVYTPPTRTPPPDPFIFGLQIKRKKKKLKGLKGARFRYQPSIYGVQLFFETGERRKKPTVLTGLKIRPVI